MPYRTSEAEVVHSLKQHLLAHGHREYQATTILVDAHASYIHSRYAKELEPFARIDYEGNYPDLICGLSSGSRQLVGAFEVKAGLGDATKGVAQALTYRTGSHQSWLALPANPGESSQYLSPLASEVGVGLFIRTAQGWQETLAPSPPRPAPWILETSLSLLRGAPAARRLQLNHPLNYMVCPYLAAEFPGQPVRKSFESHWDDLKSPGTRNHAIRGAQSLGLLDSQERLTPVGATVADLLKGVGFSLAERVNKRRRLADISLPLAAVARSFLLHQPSVQLLVDVISSFPGGVFLPVLAPHILKKDPALGTALLLKDPSMARPNFLSGSTYNPSTVFKFKQVLWHSGILRIGAHQSAGRKGTTFQPEKDAWMLEPNRPFISRGIELQ